MTSRAQRALGEGTVSGRFRQKFEARAAEYLHAFNDALGRELFVHREINDTYTSTKWRFTASQFSWSASTAYAVDLFGFPSADEADFQALGRAASSASSSPTTSPHPPSPGP